MIWILALLCLGMAGMAGFYQGPIRAGFTLVGLLVGSLLASPLSPLVQKILSAVGIKHPGWTFTLPPIIAFIAIVVIFKIVAEAVHKKVTMSQKYSEDDSRYYRWERVFQRLGICLGLFCGAAYFFALMLPIYIGGYFTLELAPGEENPAHIRLINSLRADLQSQKLDRVLAAFDPTPAPVYVASDTAALLLHNPSLFGRLGRYPVALAMVERPEFRDLSADPELQKMLKSEAKVSDILKNAKVQAILSNPVLSTEIAQLIGDNLTDLNEFLKTGKSQKYDSEKILGNWNVNLPATVSLDRKKLTNTTLTQLTRAKINVLNQTYGLSLTATTDNQAILRNLRKGEATGVTELNVLARGTWKKTGEAYEVSLPGNKPETANLAVQDGHLLLPRDGLTVVFDREM